MADRMLWTDTTGKPVITTTPNGERNARRWGWTPATAMTDDDLTAHDREVKAEVTEALRRVTRGYWGVDGDPDYPSTSGNVRRILNRTADEMEKEVTDGHA